MDAWQRAQADIAAGFAQGAEEQRRAELGRAAAALALENQERARQAAAEAAAQRRFAEEQRNREFGYRQW